MIRICEGDSQRSDAGSQVGLPVNSSCSVPATCGRKFQMQACKAVSSKPAGWSGAVSGVALERIQCSVVGRRTWASAPTAIVPAGSGEEGSAIRAAVPAALAVPIPPGQCDEVPPGWPDVGDAIDVADAALVACRAPPVGVPLDALAPGEVTDAPVAAQLVRAAASNSIQSPHNVRATAGAEGCARGQDSPRLVMISLQILDEACARTAVWMMRGDEQWFPLGASASRAQTSALAATRSDDTTRRASAREVPHGCPSGDRSERRASHPARSPR